MATLTKYGSTKRFGTRYGRRVKEKAGKIEQIMRETSLCPHCRLTKMKRLSAGIWQCSKCNIKYAGAAFSVHRQARESDKV